MSNWPTHAEHIGHKQEVATSAAAALLGKSPAASSDEPEPARNTFKNACIRLRPGTPQDPHEKPLDNKIETLKSRFLKIEIGNIQKMFTLLTKLTEIWSQTSSRALVLCAEIRQVIRNLFSRSRSSRIGQNKPKQASEFSKNQL